MGGCREVLPTGAGKGVGTDMPPISMVESGRRGVFDARGMYVQYQRIKYESMRQGYVTSYNK